MITARCDTSMSDRARSARHAASRGQTTTVSSSGRKPQLAAIRDVQPIIDKEVATAAVHCNHRSGGESLTEGFRRSLETVGTVGTTLHDLEQPAVIVRTSRFAFAPVKVVLAVPRNLICTDDVASSIPTIVNTDSFTVGAKASLAKMRQFGCCGG